MSYKQTVIRRLIRDYTTEYGTGHIASSALSLIAAQVAESVDWIRPEEFGSSDYYDIYRELVESVPAPKEALEYID
jgi:hypothetical protein